MSGVRSVSEALLMLLGDGKEHADLYSAETGCCLVGERSRL